MICGTQVPASCLQTMCRSSRFRSGWGTAISVPRRTSTRIWMRKAKAARRTPCCAVWALPPRRIRAHKGTGQATHVTWPNVGGVGGIRTHGPGRANRFRVCPVMTASIPLRIYPLPHSPGNRREQQERTDYSIRAFAVRKALQRQDFPTAVFREGFTISSQGRYDHFDTAPRLFLP